MHDAAFLCSGDHLQDTNCNITLNLPKDSNIEIEVDFYMYFQIALDIRRFVGYLLGSLLVFFLAFLPFNLSACISSWFARFLLAH
jgi:hypothetical protein